MHVSRALRQARDDGDVCPRGVPDVTSIAGGEHRFHSSGMSGGCYDRRMSGMARRRATRADLEALPRSVCAELIRGTLYTLPRPRFRHQLAGTATSAALFGSYGEGRAGPGGWWILSEPGIELPELDVIEISPDVAGWRRERMPEPPDGPILIAPDWACEVLSPSTRAHDQRIKRPLYAQAGVRWLWFIDVDARTLTASRLENGRWSELGVWADDEVARIEPFTEIEFRLADLWTR